MRTFKTLVSCAPGVCGVARDALIAKLHYVVDEVSTIEEAEVLVVICDSRDPNPPWPCEPLPPDKPVHVFTAKPPDQPCRRCENLMERGPLSTGVRTARCDSPDCGLRRRAA